MDDRQSLTDVLEEHATTPIVPTDVQLQKVSQLANDQVKLEDAIADLDKKKKSLEVSLRIIKERDMPIAMRAVGMEEFTLSTGMKIEIDKIITAGIAKKDEKVAFQYLRDNGMGGLIKRTVVAEFGKDTEEEALATAKYALEEQKCNVVEVKESVHVQSLRKTVRERIAEDLPVDDDLLGIDTVERAKITRPKKEK